MKLKLTIISLIMHSVAVCAQQLTLANAITIAQENSLDAQIARYSFMGSYWQYRSFKAQMLPSLNLNDRMVEPTEPATEIERREHLSLERAILPVAAHKAVSRYLGIEAVLLRNGDGIGKSKLLSAYRHAMHDEGNNS